MALPESSLSVICAEIAEFVRTGTHAAANHIAVTIGAPATVASEDDQNRINLFFYRFEPSGFESAVRPDQYWRLRLFCLISAFGIDDDDALAGENDLRMLGEVMRIFREQPVLDAGLIQGEQMRLQVVFSPLSDEQINQVWSTQGDATYRPSVIYEMALAPVVPSDLYTEPPRVGSLGNQAFSSSAGRYAAFSGTASAPQVPYREVDTANPLWVPEICWVHGGECAYSLGFDVDSPEFAAFAPAIWIAGDSGGSVALEWEIWDSVDGWRSGGVPVAAAPYSSAIDPENIPATVPAVFPLGVTLPVSIPGGENAAQGLLYATRTVTPEGQSPVVLRSNPLLISLYRSA